MKSEDPETPYIKHFRVFFMETVGLEANEPEEKAFIYGTFRGWAESPGVTRNRNVINHKL